MGRKAVSCPPWLVDRINLVNEFERMVAKGWTATAFGKMVIREFRPFENEYKKAMQPNHEREYDELLEKFRGIIYKKTEDAFNDLVDFVDFPSSKAALRLQLENLRADATSLRELCKLTDRASNRHRSLSARMTEFLYVALKVDGSLEIVRSGIVQRIWRERSYCANRLRSCRECGKIFWMKTRASKTCGDSYCINRADYLDNRKNKRGK